MNTFLVTFYNKDENKNISLKIIIKSVGSNFLPSTMRGSAAILVAIADCHREF